MEIPQKEPVIVQLAGDILITFRHVPGGRFRMGHRGAEENQEPVTEVEVGDFWMGETPVTQAQYRVLAGGCPGDLRALVGNRGVDPSRFKGADRPVESVSWDDAMVVARKFSSSGFLQRAGLPKGWTVTLPSEAMWEYACRAGSQWEYWNGDGEAVLSEVGWYRGNAGDETHPVGERSTNPLGLRDLHGNVREWCVDELDEAGYRLRVDGLISANGSNMARRLGNDRVRVLRGGSWFDPAEYCRSSYRKWEFPDIRFAYHGFRLCLSPGSLKPSTGPEAERLTHSGIAKLTSCSGGDIFLEP